MGDIPIVVLGCVGVGKSCLTIQYVHGHFVTEYDATIEDVYRKPVKIGERNTVLTIVDTAGQEGFGVMRSQYLRQGRGFLLVYSITDAESFQQIQKTFFEIRSLRPNSAVACVVIGNKSDNEEYRSVSTEEGRRFAESHGCRFREISAMNHDMVEQAFADLLELLGQSTRAAGANDEARDVEPTAGSGGAVPASTDAAENKRTKNGKAPKKKKGAGGESGSGGSGGGRRKFRCTCM